MRCIFDEDTRSTQLKLMPDIHPGDIYTLYNRAALI